MIKLCQELGTSLKFFSRIRKSSDQHVEAKDIESDDSSKSSSSSSSSSSSEEEIVSKSKIKAKDKKIGSVSSLDEDVGMLGVKIKKIMDDDDPGNILEIIMNENTTLQNKVLYVHMNKNKFFFCRIVRSTLYNIQRVSVCLMLLNLIYS